MKRIVVGILLVMFLASPSWGVEYRITKNSITQEYRIEVRYPSSFYGPDSVKRMVYHEDWKDFCQRYNSSPDSGCYPNRYEFLKDARKKLMDIRAAAQLKENFRIKWNLINKSWVPIEDGDGR